MVQTTEWTPEMVACLKELYDRHISDSRMAITINERFLTRVTRNAIIGKRHRLGLATTVMVKVNRPAPRRSPGGSIQPVRTGHATHLDMRKQARLEEMKLQTALPFQCTPVSWLEREGCSWPIDQSGGGLLYCNNAVLSRAPYCAHHYDAAHRRDPTPKSETNMRRFTSTGQFR